MPSGLEGESWGQTALLGGAQVICSKDEESEAQENKPEGTPIVTGGERLKAQSSDSQMWASFSSPPLGPVLLSFRTPLYLRSPIPAGLPGLRWTLMLGPRTLLPSHGKQFRLPLDLEGSYSPLS